MSETQGNRERDFVSKSLAEAVQAMLDDYEAGKTIPAFEVRQMCRKAIGLYQRHPDETDQLAQIHAMLETVAPCCHAVEGVRDLIERLEFYKQDSRECGKAVGCDHVEDGHARCVDRVVQRLTQERDELLAVPR